MIRIDPRLAKPIFEQIIDNIKESILKGVILPGEKVPSVREMAVILETNPNTVSKAYKELERQKIIETIQGRGTYVSTIFKPTMNLEKLESIKESLKKMIIEAKYLGVEQTEFIEMVQQIYKELEGCK